MAPTPEVIEAFNNLLFNMHNHAMVHGVTWSQGMTTSFVFDFDADNPENAAAWHATFETVNSIPGNNGFIMAMDPSAAKWIIETVETVRFPFFLPNHSITVNRWDSERESGRKTAIVSLFKTESTPPPPSMFGNSDNPIGGSNNPTEGYSINYPMPVDSLGTTITTTYTDSD